MENRKTFIILALAAGIIALFSITAIIIRNKVSAQSSAERQKLVNVNRYNPDEQYELPTFTTKREHSQIINHFAYTVSYNEEWRLPNWVAYSLTDKQTKGPVERHNKFVPDPDVKGATAQFWDYKNSSYDRGHMVPAGDMKWNQTAMEECFYLSNICPQNHSMNEGDWNYLENRVRGWANFFGKVYVACGPLVSEHPEVIGQNCIAVPDSFFKVVLCNMRGEWNAIGFVMPNKAQQHTLSHYCRTVDYIENLTGIDFFHNLPDDVENRIEASYNKENWRIR